MKIYEALYNSSTEESSFSTVSIHRTREGAERAVSDHKEAIKKEFFEINRNIDDWASLHYKWDSFKAWDIQETELLD